MSILTGDETPGLRRPWPTRVAALVGAFSALAVLLPAGTAGADTAFRGRIPPGELVVVQLDQTSGQSAVVVGEQFNTSPVGEQALERAPAWIRSRLEDRLARLDGELSDELAQLILELEDPRIVDEVAFAIAAVSIDHLLSPEFDPDALVLNAEALYAVDEQLHYVEIIDVGTPDVDDDFHSHTRYRMVGAKGQPAEYEIPREVYYWYVVMPTFGAEQLALVDPVTGDVATADNGGEHWRSYYLFQDEDPKRCASTHFGMEYPTLIEEPMVDGWGPSAQGVLVDFEIDPIPLVVDPTSGDPVLALFSYPGVYYDANYIATTMPLELAYREGRPELLENMLRLGNASAHLTIYDSMAIIKDRDPFGEPTVEQALADLGCDYVDVFSSDEIDDVLDLSPQYTKVIVPSGQPRELYQALADSREQIDEWLVRDVYGLKTVFQFHGAVDLDQPGDVWFDLDIPGGFSCTDQAADQPDDLVLGGYPWLLDVLATTDHVVQWSDDKQSWSGLWPMDPEESAVQLLGFFSSQHIQDRCSEIPDYYQGPDNVDFGGGLDQVLRSPYPQRTLYLHFGNCGESQDILGAATRSALLPDSSVGSFVDDHVWNLTYMNGEWITFTIFRSDGGTSFGGNTYWSEDSWASVLEWRGDGKFSNRTALYTPVVTLEVVVTDMHGRPVDGASVVVASDAAGTDPDTLVYAMQAWTDLEGLTSIELGAGRNYYLGVASPAGFWPGPEENIVTQVLTAQECAEPGQVFPIDVELDGQGPLPPWEVEVVPPAAGDTVPLTISSAVTEHSLEAWNKLYDLNFSEFGDGGQVDLVLVDEANLALLEAGAPFEALGSWPAASGVEEIVDVDRPAAGASLYLVASNATRYGHSAFAEIEVELPPAEQQAPPADGGSDESCGCYAVGARASGSSAVLWLASTLLILL
jgi:hypothetical protein